MAAPEGDGPLGASVLRIDAPSSSHQSPGPSVPGLPMNICGVAALLCLLSIVVGAVILLWSVGPSALPMWDEAYFLWSGKRFANLIEREGILRALRHYRSVKPWLMEFLLLPLNILRVESMRWYVLPAVMAYLGGCVAVFKVALQRFSFVEAGAITAAYAAVYRFRVFSISTQTEVYAFLGLTLLLVMPGMRCRPWAKVGAMALGVWLLLLAKQSHVMFFVPAAGLGLIMAGDRRERRSVALGLLLGILSILPVYLLDFKAMLNYSRYVQGLHGVPFYECLRTFFTDSIGWPVLVGFLLLFLGMAQRRHFGSARVVGLWLAVTIGWLVIYSAFISHNNFKYISPVAVPILCFPIVAFGGQRQPSKPAIHAVCLLGSLGLTLFALIWMTYASTGGRRLLALGFESSREYGTSELRAQLALAASAHEGPLKVYILGDHPFQNYSTISWLLECEGIRRYEVPYVPPGQVPDPLPGNADLLVVIGVHDGRDRVSPGEIQDTLDRLREGCSLTLMHKVPTGAPGEFSRIYRLSPGRAFPPHRLADGLGRIVFENGLTLSCASVDPTGLRIEMQADLTPARPYKVFVHVFEPGGLSNGPRQVCDISPRIATNQMRPHELYVDTVPFKQKLAAGAWVRIGLFDEADRELKRLKDADGQDALLIKYVPRADSGPAS